jgi:hypothetical protein
MITDNAIRYQIEPRAPVEVERTQGVKWPMAASAITPPTEPDCVLCFVFCALQGRPQPPAHPRSPEPQIPMMDPVASPKLVGRNSATPEFRPSCLPDRVGDPLPFDRIPIAFSKLFFKSNSCLPSPPPRALALARACHGVPYRPCQRPDISHSRDSRPRTCRTSTVPGFETPFLSQAEPLSACTGGYAPRTCPKLCLRCVVAVEVAAAEV